MEQKHNISFNVLRKLRYGLIDEYMGWKFIKLINNSFVVKKIN
jgi:hypothetical protein